MRTFYQRTVKEEIKIWFLWANQESMQRKKKQEKVLFVLIAETQNGSMATLNEGVTSAPTTSNAESETGQISEEQTNRY